MENDAIRVDARKLKLSGKRRDLATACGLLLLLVVLFFPFRRLGDVGDNSVSRSTVVTANRRRESWSSLTNPVVKSWMTLLYHAER